MIGCACSLCTIRSFAGFVIGELSAFVIFYYPSAGTEPSSPRNRVLGTGEAVHLHGSLPFFQFSGRKPRVAAFYPAPGRFFSSTRT